MFIRPVPKIRLSLNSDLLVGNHCGLYVIRNGAQITPHRHNITTLLVNHIITSFLRTRAQNSWS